MVTEQQDVAAALYDWIGERLCVGNVWQWLWAQGVLEGLLEGQFGRAPEHLVKAMENLESEVQRRTVDELRIKVNLLRSTKRLDEKAEEILGSCVWSSGDSRIRAKGNE